MWCHFTEVLPRQAKLLIRREIEEVRSCLEDDSASMQMLTVWQSAHGLARRTRAFMRARFRGTTLEQLKIDSGSETIRRQSRFPEKIGANTSSDVTSGSRERNGDEL